MSEIKKWFTEAVFRDCHTSLLITYRWHLYIYLLNNTESVVKDFINNIVRDLTVLLKAHTKEHTNNLYNNDTSALTCSHI